MKDMKQKYDHCLQHVGHNVQAQMADNQVFMGLLESVDEEHVYLLVQDHSDNVDHDGMSGYYGSHHHHGGHHGHHQGHNHHGGHHGHHQATTIMEATTVIIKPRPSWRSPRSSPRPRPSRGPSWPRISRSTPRKPPPSFGPNL
ncbi:hypothetical protein [Geomicrobium sp. JCM 19039]|uniref:hypothetical protein n=1 Tax=Geomicrobium sp. JCM 19039 TaxID=1460636 RepID=UPI00069473A1|nr:hypothetical protein [Geomicrobium sp. JCM 19039]